MNPHTFCQAVLPDIAAIALIPASAQNQQPKIVPPLHTEGQRIVDAAGHAVRLASVNCYGFDEKEYVSGGLDHAQLARIAEQIRHIGVDSERHPWAHETL